MFTSLGHYQGFCRLFHEWAEFMLLFFRHSLVFLSCQSNRDQAVNQLIIKAKPICRLYFRDSFMLFGLCLRYLLVYMRAAQYLTVCIHVVLIWYVNVCSRQAKISNFRPEVRYGPYRLGQLNDCLRLPWCQQHADVYPLRTCMY